MKKITKADLAGAWTKFKELFTPKAKRRLAIALSILLIGGAVWLNWLFFFGNEDAVSGEEASSGGESGMLGEAAYAGAETDSADAVASDSESAANYFAVTVINRQRARDEAIEVLQSLVDDSLVPDADKNDALATMKSIALAIEDEANIESLVKSKGFSDCVAVISEGCCTVVVASTGLLPNELAQIQEIVYDQSGILPANLKIIEK